GGYVALVCLLKKYKYDARWKELPLKDPVAAISVGFVKGQALLDLDFEEDSKADMDMNVAMRGKGDFIEVQATAEGDPFSRETMSAALDLAKKGIEQLFDIQKKVLE
ncbi:MAG: ribonuclease PH, partial [Candidatus Omnitrophica bacterium]|nr:ribonuclease PH [Candidatus Omnitrophota bacterium]